MALSGFATPQLGSFNFQHLLCHPTHSQYWSLPFFGGASGFEMWLLRGGCPHPVSTEWGPISIRCQMIDPLIHLIDLHQKVKCFFFSFSSSIYNCAIISSTVVSDGLCNGRAEVFWLHGGAGRPLQPLLLTHLLRVPLQDVRRPGAHHHHLRGPGDKVRIQRRFPESELPGAAEGVLRVCRAEGVRGIWRGRGWGDETIHE